MEWHLPSYDTYFKPILETTPEGFELDHLGKALTFVKQFRTAVDGGAHVGTWSVALAKRFIRVVAFEPMQETFDCLTTNLTERKVSNVKPIRAALGCIRGTCTLIKDSTRAGNSGACHLSIGRGTPALLQRLDDFKLSDVDFIKLDVEGYEEEALRGCVQTIYTSYPTIMVECKEFKPQRSRGVAGTVAFLHSLGYKEVGGVRNDRVFNYGS